MVPLDKSTKRFHKTTPRRLQTPKYCNLPVGALEITNPVLNLALSNGRRRKKLRRLLLSDGGSENVLAVIRMGVPLEIREVGYDHQVRSKYHDGIWFIRLGQDATGIYVCAELNILVSRVCSAEFASRFFDLLRKREGIATAILEMVEELEKMSFLLIFDDVWEKNDAYPIVKQIVNAVASSPGRLRMLISTRSEFVSNSLTNAVFNYGNLQLRAKNARVHLCGQAGVNLISLPDRSTNAGKAVEDILEKCSGVQLTLSVAGRTVRAYITDTAEEEGCASSSWIRFRDSLNVSTMRLGKKGLNKHEEALFACIYVSMCEIEKKWSTSITETVRGLLGSLCIFPERTWIPLETLQRMWGIPPEQTELFIDILSDHNIVSHAVQERRRSLRVHYPILKYCGVLAEEDNRKAEWHKRLLRGYYHDLDQLEGETVSCVNWWSEKLSTDFYIHKNVMRHLLGCGMLDEALRLACDYRWMKMLNTDDECPPFTRCVEDLKRLELLLSGHSDRGIQAKRDVQLLRETMELCVLSCAESRDECSFQLYGRLACFNELPALFVRCLWSIDTYGGKQFFRPTPMLQAIDNNLNGIDLLPFPVISMEHGIGKDDLVLCGVDGQLAVKNLYDRGVRSLAEAGEHWMTALAVDNSTGEIFYSSRDRAVRVLLEGEKVRSFLPFGRDVFETVTCLKVLGQLRLIAVGSSEGRLRIIDTVTGIMVQTMIGHCRRVLSLAANQSGELLVSASQDRTIRIWHSRTGKAVGKPLRGHTGGVNHVALHPDGHIIASGSEDKAVRLWEVRQGVPVGPVLIGHKYSVSSVLFSREGDVLYSACFNEVLGWDVRTPQGGVSIKHRLSHDDMSWITWLCLGHNGEDLLAASRWRQKLFSWGVGVQEPARKPKQLKESSMHGIGLSSVSWSTRKIKGNIYSVWAKPAPGVLAGAGTFVKRIVPLPFLCRSVEAGVKGDELLFGGDSGQIAFVDMHDGKLRMTKEGGGAVTDLEVNWRSGEIFCSSLRGPVRVWREGTQERQFLPFGEDAGEWVTCMKLLLPLKMIACGSNKGRLFLMDVTAGAIVRTISNQTEYIDLIAAREDGEMLISASSHHDCAIQRWDTKSGLGIGEPLRGHTRDINCLELSPNGQLIASCSYDETIRLWDSEKGAEVCATLRGHCSYAQSMRFSREGDVLFSGGRDEILVWDVRNPANGVFMKRKLLHSMGYVSSLFLSRNGEELFVISERNPQVFVWRARTPEDALDRSTPGESFSRNITVFGISSNGEIMATCSRDSETTLDIRRVGDVSGDIDRVLFSCEMTCFPVNHVSVTNDMQLVAYSTSIVTVYIALVKTGTVISKLIWPNMRMRSFNVPFEESAITSLAFNPEGNKITAKARVMRATPSSEQIEWFSKSMRWSTYTGSPCPEKRGSSGSAIEAKVVREPLPLRLPMSIMEKAIGDIDKRSVSPPRRAPTYLSIKERESGRGGPFTNKVLLSEGNNHSICGTLEVAPQCAYFEDAAKRLWITVKDRGLQFIDLIDGSKADLETTPPSIPLIQGSSSLHAPKRALSPGGPSTTNPSTKYTVFISYSEPDKPLADWLYNRLSALGISVFVTKSEVKVSDNASKVLLEAMENADIAIIIVSPEYPAKKWRMKELLCFQRRKREAKEMGTVQPIIIPLFFRMSVRECKSLDAIMDMKTRNGENVFIHHGFYQRLAELSVGDMQKAMMELGDIQGIENLKGISYEPQRGQKEEEWLEELGHMLEEVVVPVQGIVSSLGKRTVHASIPKPIPSKAAGSSSPKAGPSCNR